MQCASDTILGSALAKPLVLLTVSPKVDFCPVERLTSGCDVSTVCMG